MKLYALVNIFTNAPLGAVEMLDDEEEHPSDENPLFPSVYIGTVEDENEGYDLFQSMVVESSEGNLRWRDDESMLLPNMSETLRKKTLWDEVTRPRKLTIW